ncbi:GIY-YIG nuclease family protein [Algoriphagus pacificus]|uniref:GIY-YIG nuclease family protein n=1 Tax=Algoriphagus pacificus TaxID=2811234 RepID=UPI001F163A20|nr:GIY-YIG nuclease family protein [Algoriphagus pacificus]
MERFFVYILKCADSSYYTGVTNNIDRRFAEHQDGIDFLSYTYNRRPLELVFLQDFQQINEAIAFEKQLKKWSRAKKEALIRGNWEQLKDLSKCNNETSHLNFRKDK